MVDKTITRTDLLNFLVEKYDLRTYLEIGLQDRTQNFDKIKCREKVSVDPDPNAGATWEMTSDEFFRMMESVKECEAIPTKSYSGLNAEVMTSRYWHPFDLVFIDGMHTAEQVKKDFENALKVLSPSGWVVIHDCNPLNEEHTIVPRPTERGHWNGDVYKFAAWFGIDHNWVRVTVDIDNGCMVYSHRDNLGSPHPLQVPDISWEEFNKNKDRFLNLRTWDEFVKIYNGK